ncbi:PD-(D/E)XK nuclease domain-containing protein [Anaerobiospirillum succiniciproducens]|uniref:PD-(D/E)XK nuclease domain-containing protein n=1 Tax=Anaerobiospirillum succiniciproducens TaxID=13335 RepID=UPI00248F2CCC|nr:PD-(D/E)XK nuclease domain-containing protein [Anaerobiospirillum succiniciproducens]
MALVKLIDGWLNDAPWEFFLSSVYENQITYLIYLELLIVRVPTQREVCSAKGRADIVIYKEVEDQKVIETVIEFKLAKQEDNILDKLQDGSVQLIERRYGLNASTTYPKRYCVVISTELRQVGAIAEIDSNDKQIMIYQSPFLDGDGRAMTKSLREELIVKNLQRTLESSQ